jgi:DNA topoisomerase-3
MPTVCELRDGTTTAPSYLTEADLVTMMDRNGIGRELISLCNHVGLRQTPGTDATIAQHIQTIIDREYVTERMDGRTKYLLPSTLGIGLVEGYNKIGFDKSLSKPHLRREVSYVAISDVGAVNHAPLKIDREDDGASLRATEDESADA